MDWRHGNCANFRTKKTEDFKRAATAAWGVFQAEKTENIVQGEQGCRQEKGWESPKSYSIGVFPAIVALKCSMEQHSHWTAAAETVNAVRSAPEHHAVEQTPLVASRTCVNSPITCRDRPPIQPCSELDEPQSGWDSSIRDDNDNGNSEVSSADGAEQSGIRAAWMRLQQPPSGMLDGECHGLVVIICTSEKQNISSQMVNL